MMREDLIQFIWQHKLLKPLPLITVSGKEIKVLKPGDLNRDSGPDFFNARIALDNIVLAGNIEVHVNSSDWLKHKHQEDTGYDNIILHVVHTYDKQVEQNTRFNVEVLELKELISEETISRYNQLISSKQTLPCDKQLKQCDDLHFSLWLDRVLIERLESKESLIGDLFNSQEGNFTQTFFVLLLKGFGFRVNSTAFELLGRQLPNALILRHANNLLQTEALLLGMAGLLEETHEEKYVRELQNEFEFLRQKYSLIPLNKKLMKYSRMRPFNFPDLRLAQFAALVHSFPVFFQSPHEFTTVINLKKVFNIQVSGYWRTHYRLGCEAKQITGTLGNESMEILLINTVVPFLFFYSRKLNKSQLKEMALQLLEDCDIENNHKTRLFKEKKYILQSAAQSQACIQLFDNYCSKKKCLHCGIAASLLNDKGLS